MLYEYLKLKYGENEPIILTDISIEGMTKNNMRQQIKYLTDTGKLIRYDTGIYFMPKKSILNFGSYISIDDVITAKYLKDQKGRCGYLSGIGFANSIGITTQVPMTYSLVSNKATTECRKTCIRGFQVTVRSPKLRVNDTNYRSLQFLDLMKDVDRIAEVSDELLLQKLLSYIEKAGISLEDLKKYMNLYPEKTYKNFMETGLIYELFTRQQGGNGRNT